MSGYFGENLFFPEILGLKSCIMPPSSLVLEINWKREENGEGWGRGNPERECTQLCGIIAAHRTKKEILWDFLCGSSGLCLILR